MRELDIIRKSKTFCRLSERLSSGRLFHCFILCSPCELTNRYLATALAIQLLANGEDLNATEAKVCSSSHPDYFFYDGAFKVKDANEIYDKASIHAMLGKRKVFVLHGFEFATQQAQNKMLKTLEEPGDGCYFILTCKNSENILQTVRSRSLEMQVEHESKQDAELKLGSLYKEDCFNGLLGSCFPLANADFTQQAKGIARDIFDNMRSSKAVLKFESKLKDREFALKVLRFLEQLYGEARQNLISFGSDFFDENSRVFGLNADCLSNIIFEIQNAEKELADMVTSQLSIDNLFLKILEEEYLCRRG